MENLDLVADMSRWIHFMAGVMWIGLLVLLQLSSWAALKHAGADGTQQYHQTCRATRAAVLPLVGCLLACVVLRCCGRCLSMRSCCVTGWADGDRRVAGHDMADQRVGG